MSSAAAALRGFAFRRRLLGWKIVPSLGVALVPSLIALTFTLAPNHGSQVPTPYRFYGEYLAPLCLYFVAPFVSMFTLLPLLGALYEKGAVGYLVTRPVPRRQVVFGLYQGGLLAMLPLMVLAAVLPALILSPLSGGVELRFWVRRVAALAGLLGIAGAVYGALCLFLGIWSKKAILWALGLLIGWGSVAGSIPGALRSTSLHRYLFALMRDGLDVGNAWSGMFVPDPEPPGMVLSLGVLAGALAVFLRLAVGARRRRDVL